MDIELHCEETGSGEPLVLLHGNGEDGTYFAHQIAHFSQRFRVLALDTRGHGKSPRGEAPFTIRQFARDLLAFLDARGIERAHLLGFSDGGNIALVFALAHPERVGKLVLNGANLNTRGVKRSVQAPIELGYRMARLFAGLSAKARANAEMLGLMVNDPNVAPEELAALTAPTLVIAGENDMIREDHTRLIAERIPNARLASSPATTSSPPRTPQPSTAKSSASCWSIGASADAGAGRPRHPPHDHLRGDFPTPTRPFARYFGVRHSHGSGAARPRTPMMIISMPFWNDSSE